VQRYDQIPAPSAMTIDPQQLEAALPTAAMRLLRANGLSLQDRALAIKMVRDALALGRSEQTLPLLTALARLAPRDGEVVLLQGVALRLAQRLDEAESVFAQAQASGLTDPQIVQGLAQTRYERGLPAAALFAQVQAASPDNPDVIRSRANALAAEGNPAEAETLLETALHQTPGWLAGHKTLATLRWTSGDPARFDASYAAACHAQANNKDLWLAWFGAVAQTRDWAATRTVIDRAEAALGPSPAWQTAQLFLALESGDLSGAEQLIQQTANLTGETVSLCRVRYALRTGAYHEAASYCETLVAGPSAPLFLPYLSLAWRLLGDERWVWLDRPDALVRAVTVELDQGELADLAEVLRGLHVMERPYAEQSVRGGTQTDRSVILRHEPIIAKARTAWLGAIRSYVDALPPQEDGHPLLGRSRRELYIEGSWSVRLHAQGYNVPHNHPAGWLSTAFYIALPSLAAMGPAPSGHIAFGAPPEELGLNLEPYATIAPVAGQTAVFPSYLWHRTFPFGDGERLIMALDIRPPRF
jgi:tetratricopeptide (TPR) repeat protein